MESRHRAGFGVGIWWHLREMGRDLMSWRRAKGSCLTPGQSLPALLTPQQVGLRATEYRGHNNHQLPRKPHLSIDSRTKWIRVSLG